MTLVPDIAVFQKSLATLPTATYQSGETVLTAGSRTGLLLILKKGAVAIFEGNIEMAKVTEPGAVFICIARSTTRSGSACFGNHAVSCR
jgi:hypothetical protein